MLSVKYIDVSAITYGNVQNLNHIIKPILYYYLYLLLVVCKNV